ncbi:MAG TPA: PAS domain-containing protein, partial [Chloroflexota bacterium]|nr:PAS domain-containing protein [Chloroflexota bacterium]
MTGLNATGAWDAPPGDWPAGGGDLGALVRSFDWSKTSLGPKATWPQSLKTAVDILLQSPVPIVMLWGADGVMIYNDAYSVFAGLRHPSLLGCKVLEGWPEVAAFNANVMRVGLSGGTLAYRDQHLVLYRNGKPEDVWMNLDYSPVLDESGRPAGVLAVVVETTGRVIGERRLRTLRELGSRTTSPDTSEKVCAAVAEVLADNRDDLPAALLYLLTGSDQARLAASVGATARDDSQVIDLRSNAPDAQALERARATGRDVEVAASAFRSIPPAPHRSSRSLVLPITAHETPAGFLVVGLNEFLTTPGDYHDFLRLVAS